ncbi:MAG: phenylalanine--tRNA ligase subunit beta, partial [Roseovarius sp.]
TAMILELCGGEASEMFVAGAVPDTARSYPLDPKRVVSLVGMEIAEEEQLRILRDLGFDPVNTQSGIEVGVPSWRPDVLGEADLIEEIVRVASMTKLVGKPLPPVHDGVAKPILTPMQLRARKARGHFAALGYNECVTYSFIEQKHAALFGGGSDATSLGNPISSEMSHMRPSMLAGLLSAAARNQARGYNDLSLFEVGTVFAGGEPGEQMLQACGLLVGSAAGRDAHNSRRPFDLADARGDADALLDAIGAPAKRMTMRGAPEWFHPGRSGRLTLGPKVTLAEFGEVHPKILSAMDVKGPALAVILHLENAPFPKVKTATRAALDISDLQAVERDFAFVVDVDLEVETLLNAAKGADKKLIEAAYVFDVFSGEKAEAQMGEGKKSVAISVRLQPRTATLTDKEIEAVSASVVEKVAKATGGTLRG